MPLESQSLLWFASAGAADFSPPALPNSRDRRFDQGSSDRYRAPTQRTFISDQANETARGQYEVLITRYR